MDIPKHLAIGAFCKIIDELPSESRHTALGFICAAVGKSPEQTGLAFSVDRPIRHLYWDLEIEDLYDRLEYLVETIGLKEQLVVQGAVSYIETHFAQWADLDFSHSCVAGFQRTIEKMQHQLTLPAELREDKQPDNQIEEFITKLNEAIESAEARRIDAEETLEHLRSEFDAVFTLEFWDLLNHLKIEEMWPRLEKLFREADENTGEEEEDEESGEI